MTLHGGDEPVTVPATSPEPIPGVSEWCADGSIHDIGHCPIGTPIPGPIAVENSPTASIGQLPDTGYGSVDMTGISLTLAGLLLIVALLAGLGLLLSRQSR